MAEDSARGGALALASAQASRPASPKSAAFGKLTELFAPLRGSPALRRAAPLLALVAATAVLALLWLAIATPPQRPLFPDMAEADKAALVEALGAAGIAHGVDGATGAVTVAESDYHTARMAAASEGLPHGAGSGMDVMAEMPLGASRAVEGERIRSAREADLARTIEAMDAVSVARVHLALPEPSAFVRRASEPAASVMLELAGGGTLSTAQVQGIVHLVASSVPGLAPDQVAVTDQRGSLLSGSDAAGNRQRETIEATEADLRDAIAAILTPVLGAGNFAAEVAADVDFSDIQSTREGFPAASSALRRESRVVSSDGSSAGVGGIPGALANQAPADATVSTTPGAALADPAAPGAPPPMLRQSENLARDFAVGREVSVTQQQTPRLTRLSVAVVLRNAPGARARSAADIRQIEALVKGAVGFDAARGDSVEVAARAFAPVTESSASWWESSWFAGYLRTGAASLVALAFILVIARPLLKKAFNGERGPTPLALPSADTTDGTAAAPITVEMIEGSPAYEARAALLRGFVKQDPARAALVVGDLMRSGAR